MIHETEAAAEVRLTDVPSLTADTDTEALGFRSGLPRVEVEAPSVGLPEIRLKECGMTSESTSLIDRVRLEGGTNHDDLGFIERALTQLFTQLDRFDTDKVDIALRVKDRGRPGMKTTLEVHVEGFPSIVGVSTVQDMLPALNDAESKVLHQLRGRVGRDVSSRKPRG